MLIIILMQWKMKSCVTPPQAGPCFDDPDFGGERYCAAGATPEEVPPPQPQPPPLLMPQSSPAQAPLQPPPHTNLQLYIIPPKCSPPPGTPTHNLPSTHNPAIRPRPSHSQHTDPPIPHQIDAVDSLYRDESDDVFEGNGCAYGLSGVECDRFEYINCPAVGGKEDF